MHYFSAVFFCDAVPVPAKAAQDGCRINSQAGVPANKLATTTGRITARIFIRLLVKYHMPSKLYISSVPSLLIVLLVYVLNTQLAFICFISIRERLNFCVIFLANHTRVLNI